MERVFDNLCFECKACVQVCPYNAISMIENCEGFSYPVISQTLCVDCGLCKKVCPSWHAKNLKQKHLQVLAAQLDDKETLGLSSSGGIFSLLAEYVLNKGGIVYGAAFDENLQCHHIGIDNVSGLTRLRGSKYVHSDIGLSYVETQSLLKQGRWVYFTGTPCQIAGLKLFLRKDYPTLLTSDLICHGTPSQKVFDRFVQGMENDINRKVVGWNFRDKRIKGWSCTSSSTSIDAKGKTHRHILNKNMTAYYKAFMHGDLFRMDCYQCPFACQERVSDITIGDYWGVKRYHIFEERSKGISLVIINNHKGMVIWEELKDKTTFQTSKMEWAMQTNNRNLYQSSSMPEGRKEAFHRVFYNYEDFRDSFLDSYNPIQFYITYYKYQIKNSSFGTFLISIKKTIRKK